MKRIPAIFLCGISSIGLALAACATDPTGTPTALMNQPLDPSTVSNAYMSSPPVSSPQVTDVSLTLNATDLQFILSAKADAQFESQAGQLIIARSNNSQVTALGQQMIDDYGKINSELDTLIQHYGVSDSPILSPDDQWKIDQLNTLQGSQLDEEFLRQQRVEHDRMIPLYQRAAENAEGEDVRVFAAMTIPLLEDQANMIYQINTSTGEPK